MKKLVVILCIILSLFLVACSSIGEVKDKISDCGYQEIDVIEMKDLTSTQQYMANTILTEGKYTMLKTAIKDDKNATISVFTKNSGIVFDYAIVVEFSSQKALVDKINDDANMLNLAKEIVGSDGDTISLLKEKGAIYNNCFIYAKGPKKAQLYTALTEK